MNGLDAPLAAGDLREAGGTGLLRAEAGDGMHDFLADQRAVGVVAVTADPSNPADVREVDVPGAGDPDGAADDQAVAAVQFRVVRLTRALFLDGVEDCPLQGRLVALEEQEVVRFAVPVIFRPVRAENLVRACDLRSCLLGVWP